MDAEDNKLVTLARATRARVGAQQGAALRDLDGRTYAGASVDLPSLRLSAIAATVAMAIAGGSTGAEALVLLGAEATSEEDLRILRDFAGAGVPVHLGDAAGRMQQEVST